MSIKYVEAPDIKRMVERVATQLNFHHVDLNGMYCYRSYSSRSKRTVARIHNLSKLWQRALGIRASYLIEVISERFDKLSQEEKEKVVIHELLHVPQGFGGGFRPHKGYITMRKIDSLHDKLVNMK